MEDVLVQIFPQYGLIASHVSAPLMVLIVAWGYFLTDKLYLQDCVSFPIKYNIQFNKAWIVFLANIPLVSIYVLSQKVTWEIGINSFVYANILYTLFVKKLLSKFK